MAKSPTAKTNGHTVAALKPAAPKKAAPAAARKPAAKPAAKPAVKPAAKKAALKPAAKPALKGAPKPAAKPAVKPAAAKPAAKPAAKAAAPAAKPAPKARTEPIPAPQADAPGMAGDKVRKAKLVRDSFTMPEQEYAVLGQVKKACIKAGFEIKKSELLRIGVALISQLDMATLQKVLGSLPQLKTGRPKND
jgi:hypothetical protein